MKIHIPTKLALVLLVASVIPLAIAVTLTYYDAASDIRTLASREVRERGRDAAEDVKKELKVLTLYARQLSADPNVAGILQEYAARSNHAENQNIDWAALHEDQEPLQSLLNNPVSRHMRAHNMVFRSFLVYASDGTPLAATAKPRAMAAHDTRWWQRAQAAEPRVSTVIDESPALELSICTRILDGQNRLIGVTRSVINASTLFDAALDSPSPAFDAQVEVVYASKVVSSNASGRIGSTVDVSRAEVQKGKSIVHVVQVDLPIAGADTFVVARKTMTIGLNEIGEQVDTLVLLSCGSILVFFLIGLYILHHHIMMPIQRLTTGARILAGGNLAHRIHPHDGESAKKGPMDGDELDELANEFNVMADTLMRSHEGLEGMVDQRTKELAAENRRSAEARAKLEEAMAKLRETQANLIQTEKLASLGQLVAGVAHEINNPLSFILNNLSVIERDYRAILSMLLEYRRMRINGTVDDSRLRHLAEREDEVDVEYLDKSVDRIFSSTMNGLNRVKTIVMDLKDFSRPDTMEAESVSIEQSLDTTLELVGYHVLTKGIHIVREYGGVPMVRCYAGRLNQVFLNLIVNAIQAIDTTGTITLRTYARDGRVFVQISDTGCGIRPEHLNKIFDPFFTTKKQGDGTGLGLSVSYGIVREHNGTIEVKSKPSEGATFTVSLPLKFTESTA